MKTLKPTSIVVVSDIHCGSDYAVMPERFTLRSGTTITASPRKLALFTCWKDLARKWNAPDLLIVNGDATDGGARKDYASVLWAPKLLDQIDACVELLAMFNPRAVICIHGSGYHVDAAGVALEEVLAGGLKAHGLPVMRAGHGSKELAAGEFFIEVYGKVFHFSHHIATSLGPFYKSTPVARELAMSMLNASHKHKIDILVRSHVHSFVCVEFTRQRGYITPCWQTQTPYMLKKSAFGMMPDFGGLRFLVHPDGDVDLEKQFYKPHEVKPTLHHYHEQTKTITKGKRSTGHVADTSQQL